MFAAFAEKFTGVERSVLLEHRGLGGRGGLGGVSLAGGCVFAGRFLAGRFLGHHRSKVLHSEDAERILAPETPGRPGGGPGILA